MAKRREEWLDVRLRHHNWKTEHLYEQNRQCHYCRVELDDGDPRHVSTLDHVVPTARGGKDTKENTVAACHECNARKGAMSAEEYFLILNRTVRVFGLRTKNGSTKSG